MFALAITLILLDGSVYHTPAFDTYSSLVTCKEHVDDQKVKWKQDFLEKTGVPENFVVITGACVKLNNGDPA